METIGDRNRRFLKSETKKAFGFEGEGEGTSFAYRR